MEIPAHYGVVLVTTANKQEAETIANALVEAQLAACVSLLPIHSIYSWEGEIYKEYEWQLLIKTDLALFSSLEAKIRELHSYEVSEIIALPIVAGSQAYLQWISQQLKSY
ncbi:divalent-cation tolerance protein CutA [Anabaenopsis tanganyikae CS-531]|jgi:periplasmic divalent cation tolerance protein|uniref:Divalent-cation tolerance protein CutA n=2 Tax=Anabaenopsis TaxID=110103 RepID=A0ABT6KHK0_9CYAN|nr:MULTISPECIES: divalent-cation tolerance protein CutA [Nostocales]MDB9445934.1 divalent-cation tolerance protein CutA [Anabaena sp. CS-542/02]MDB9539818.1 divalent-cation tolerance protein CutA [Anabaenopsis arnoldii]MDH6092123.1 divalent-cation tolerance protein CutA [Anabaenopsis arnoldii]MDH6099454.1 divalent-cation tolerance protein CutA [Anabaenopsis sp. FSS-46]MDH6106829.1 divalent-cation tolerance protein CutA [Anabaenopsis tanganyikae CS-531]